MVAICTVSFNIHKFWVLPTMYLHVFFNGSPNKQLLFLCTIKNLTVFITEQSIYCLLGL